MEKPDVTIIGLGALGTTLVRALVEKGVEVKSVYNRTSKTAYSVARKLNIDIAGGFPSGINELGEIVFITVSDGAISEITARLKKLSGNVEDHTFVHCSGSESAELLSPLRKEGGAVASFHPLQTFTSSSTTDDFSDIFFSLQGDEKSFGLLRKIAKSLGAKAMEVTASQKSHLHVAGVMASNYLHALLQSSVSLAEISGLPAEDIKRALLPLVQTSLNNAKQSSFEAALSGPIKRGDITTVKKHLDILKDNPELLEVYKTLGNRTVDMVRDAGHLGQDTAINLSNLLK
ncbi:DUF2520 domain-containing protein [Aliifodinibius salicampi]|uniref:DUF2520 domain-containing protein n=1 Tax=Fodinibius salicampi TaxID=1920655 RepID=A0ABT3PWB2_9BACT|nr:Rossmann-like and DUF2520 domain-containing protein [Fodinibius salicampi]MCW9712133.1 DUF2520 domain-containing protein [Fodinibius salicampi]